ncbi:MAG: hypothetical protein GY953_39195, partial [bacterium]|nr:hypothetical protein [bacterium]
MRYAKALIALLALVLAGCSGADEYDLAVYGGTAGGVMTGISAAREGARVVVL